MAYDRAAVKQKGLAAITNFDLSMYLDLLNPKELETYLATAEAAGDDASIMAVAAARAAAATKAAAGDGSDDGGDDDLADRDDDTANMIRDDQEAIVPKGKGRATARGGRGRGRGGAVGGAKGTTVARRRRIASASAALISEVTSGGVTGEVSSPAAAATARTKKRQQQQPRRSSRKTKSTRRYSFSSEDDLGSSSTTSSSSSGWSSGSSSSEDSDVDELLVIPPGDTGDDQVTSDGGSDRLAAAARRGKSKHMGTFNSGGKRVPVAASPAVAEAAARSPNLAAVAAAATTAAARATRSKRRAAEAAVIDPLPGQITLVQSQQQQQQEEQQVQNGEPQYVQDSAARADEHAVNGKRQRVETVTAFSSPVTTGRIRGATPASPGAMLAVPQALYRSSTAPAWALQHAAATASAPTSLGFPQLARSSSAIPPFATTNVPLTGPLTGQRWVAVGQHGRTAFMGQQLNLGQQQHQRMILPHGWTIIHPQSQQQQQQQEVQVTGPQLWPMLSVNTATPAPNGMSTALPVAVAAAEDEEAPLQPEDLEGLPQLPDGLQELQLVAQETLLTVQLPPAALPSSAAVNQPVTNQQNLVSLASVQYDSARVTQSDTSDMVIGGDSGHGAAAKEGEQQGHQMVVNVDNQAWRMDSNVSAQTNDNAAAAPATTTASTAAGVVSPVLAGPSAPAGVVATASMGGEHMVVQVDPMGVVVDVEGRSGAAAGAAGLHGEVSSSSCICHDRDIVVITFHDMP